MGYGGTFGMAGNPGDPGLSETQGFWKAADRGDFITVRKLRAVRKVLQGQLGKKSRAAGMHVMRLCVDNTGVVAAARSSPPPPGQ